jgi:hypothetical protein
MAHRHAGPGRVLRVTDAVGSGRWTLEMRVGPVSREGTRYHQRAVFEPRGLTGEAYWYGGVLRHWRTFRRIFDAVLARD